MTRRARFQRVKIAQVFSFACLKKESFIFFKDFFQDFPGGEVDKNLPANAGDTDSIPGLGRFHMPQKN